MRHSSLSSSLRIRQYVDGENLQGHHLLFWTLNHHLSLEPYLRKWESYVSLTLAYDKEEVSMSIKTYQFIASVSANKGTVARNARANCHAAINETTKPTNKDVIELTVAPVP